MLKGDRAFCLPLLQGKGEADVTVTAEVASWLHIEEAPEAEAIMRVAAIDALSDHEETCEAYEEEKQEALCLRKFEERIKEWAQSTGEIALEMAAYDHG